MALYSQETFKKCNKCGGSIFKKDNIYIFSEEQDNRYLTTKKIIKEQCIGKVLECIECNEKERIEE